MKRTLIIFLACCTPLLAFSNNGQLTYSPPKVVKVDGKTTDWDGIEPTALAKPTKSLTASFKTSYQLEGQALNFLVVVEDNSYQFSKANAWYQNDNLVIYLNPIHSEVAATCSMVIVNERGITIHQPDEAHQVLNKQYIQTKVLRKRGKTIYEGSIKLGDYVQANRSIGFDMMVVDADKAQNTTYNNWGPGGNKEYRSGQLGDLVFLASLTDVFGTVEGKVKWKDNQQDALPAVIKVKSKKHPKFWVNTALDSLGHFSVELPVGTYALYAAHKIGASSLDNGYNNQLRTDTHAQLGFTVVESQTSDIGLFSIPTYKFPSYLYHEQGVLHDYDASKKEEVDGFIQATCKYYNIPGASVAMVKDGRIVYHNVFGVDNLLTQQPVSGQTKFQAASVTKSVFAFIVLRLVEQGIIDLDKPLYQYLPFENIAHDPHYQLITAKWVLSHRSGLPNWAFGGPGRYKNGQKANLAFEPGTRFQYSGEAFEYLGRVVEHLTQKGLSQLLEEEVVKPLKIPPLYFHDDGTLDCANGHYADGRPTYWGMPPVPGVAHSMLTEAKAFAHWMSALANQKGLSQAMYQRLQQRLSTTDQFNSPENLYWNVGVSLGFFVQDTPYGTAILHGGNNGDFQAEFILFPESKMGFVVFTNSNAGHKLGQHLGKYLIHGNKG